MILWTIEQPAVFRPGARVEIDPPSLPGSPSKQTKGTITRRTFKRKVWTVQCDDGNKFNYHEGWLKLI